MPFQAVKKGVWRDRQNTSPDCSLSIYAGNKFALNIRFSRAALDHLGASYVTFAQGTGADAGLLYIAPSTEDAPNAYSVHGNSKSDRKTTITATRLGLKSIPVKTVKCPMEPAGAGIILNIRPFIQAQANGAAGAEVSRKPRTIEVRPAV